MEVLITNFHPGDGGGHTTYIESLVKGTFGAVNYTIAAPSTSKIASIAKTLPCRYVAIDFPGKLREIKDIIKSRRKLSELIADSSFDVIHVNGSPDHRLIMYSLVNLVFCSDRPKIIYTKHNSFAVKRGFLASIRYRYFCDAVITVCDIHKHEFLELLRGKPVHVIANGVDIGIYRPGDKSARLHLRDRLDLPADSTIFVSCAGNAEHKGWHLLARVAKDFQGVFILLLGHRPSADKLAALFDDGVPDNLIFAGQQADIIPFLQGSDVGFVLSTSVETISFACREMMACGLPMIVSDYGCLKQNVTESSGWITQAGSENSIASAVASVLRADLSKMGRAARLRAEAKFGVEQFLEQTLKAYSKLLGD